MRTDYMKLGVEKLLILVLMSDRTIMSIMEVWME